MANTQIEDPFYFSGRAVSICKVEDGGQAVVVQIGFSQVYARRCYYYQASRCLSQIRRSQQPGKILTYRSKRLR